MVAQAEEGGFDVDEVAGESLDLPELPPPALTLPYIDLALNRDDVRPPGCEWKPLAPGSYSLRLPGMTKPIRDTTSADLFESHGLLSPGGTLFEVMANNVSADESLEGALHGNIRLVPTAPEQGELEMVVRTRDGETRISSLDELIADLEQLAPPAGGETS